MQYVINVLLSLASFIVLQLIGVFLLTKLTKYDDQAELAKGNESVGIIFRGQFIATAIIMAVSAYTNHDILHMIMWFVMGYVCLLVAIVIFEVATRRFKVSEAIANDNKAVAHYVEGILLGTAITVSSLII